MKSGAVGLDISEDTAREALSTRYDDDENLWPKAEEMVG